ncbi:MAG TPA: hypothetical protein VK866_14905 [Acidimicrobiales bacterium]|nr:hypothetical protein [Acidimicrobiales bacterium]
MHPRHQDRIQPLHDRVQLSSTERHVIAAMEADLARTAPAAPPTVARSSGWRDAGPPWWLRATLTALAGVLTALTVTVSPLFGIGAAIPLGVLAVSATGHWEGRDDRPLRHRITWWRRVS